jgi:hypothetical protein
MHDTDNDADDTDVPLPTITLPRGGYRGVGAEGDALISDVFSANEHRRLKALNIDRLDTLSLALYVERYDDTSAHDAVTIAEDELSQRDGESPGTAGEEHTNGKSGGSAP